ncbi:MAG: hypothetical protein ACK559_33555, partial [bacterium]
DDAVRVAAHDAIGAGTQRPALRHVDISECLGVLALPDMLRQDGEARHLSGCERVLRPARARLVQLDAHGARVDGRGALHPFAEGARQRQLGRGGRQRVEGDGAGGGGDG